MFNFPYNVCWMFNVIDHLYTRLAFSFTWRNKYIIIVVFTLINLCFVYNRSIMSDIQRDNRVVSLSSRAGIRSSLVTILDQLQRCQKSLNEFLEVDTKALCLYMRLQEGHRLVLKFVFVWLL